MTHVAGLLLLNDDVIITPVSELSQELRAQAECLPEDVAVSRLRGRGGSTIVDADSARLLDRFREPRTLVEAVILYAREKGAAPTEVLESAYPLLKGMVQRGVLVHPEARGDRNGDSSAPWTAATRLPIGRVVRALQVLDDGEVYQLERPDGEPAILKVAQGDAARLRQEARVLAWLNGRVAPRLLEEGELDGRYYILIEHVPGVDAVAALHEGRTRSATARRGAALALARRVADAYAELHALGVLHGDVHPRNLLVVRDGNVRLIDFGFASGITEQVPLPRATDRGGVAFFFEPEFAEAAVEDRVPPSPSAAGEQFAVAALIYFLVTGEYWQRFRLARREMLLDITQRAPRSFVECGVEAWPELECVLQRALSRAPEDRWPSMAELALALHRVVQPEECSGSVVTLPTVPTRNERVFRELALEGPLFGQELPAPAVSINYGAAGIALGALHGAQRRAAPELLAAADAWIRRAVLGSEREDAFYNAQIEISPELVGAASPYHTPSGVHAVEALIARAFGDTGRQERAVAAYLECAARPAAGLDLTLGRASTLLGAAILLDALPQTAERSEAELRAFGTDTMSALWTQLEAMGPVGIGDVTYLGMAHGWAGFLYAMLTWGAVARVAVPDGVERRLDELAALAMPSGRGLEWAWVLNQPGDPPTMSGWCNGSCGYVFLWTLANRSLGNPRYLDTAVGAGWSSWDSPDTAASLCCGLAGRGYALLNLFRHTGERHWLDRARVLCDRADQEGQIHREYPHSLWKGELGVGVLAADLEDAEWARMPFFEPAGYRDRAGEIETA
jgi:eukaryotic-like serine/threonine-protein kinase